MFKVLEPKEVIIDERTYILSKFDCWAGREIITQYPISALPRVGDYKANEDLVARLMSYVSVPQPSGEPLRLSTKVLVQNHVPSWETLAKIEMAMIEYNCSFFQNGRAWTSLEGIAQKVLRLISKTLTDLSGPLSPAEKPPLKN